MDAKTKIRLTAAQKAALKAAFVPYCPHLKTNCEADINTCRLKEYRERCEYSTWVTFTDCPLDCPHHLLQTKVSCTPENCTIANKFVDEVRAALMQ